MVIQERINKCYEWGLKVILMGDFNIKINSPTSESKDPNLSLLRYLL